jgi:ribosomal-protein-alanine N-acetyltransferase
LTESKVELRPFLKEDLDFLDRLSAEPQALGEFEWHGFGDPTARRKRWEQDGYVGQQSTALAVLFAGELAGIVSWQPHDWAPPTGACYEIGVALLPEHRGRGLGTATHAALIDYLFNYTRTHRLQAAVESGNIAEERTLEKLGFQREGLLREVLFRAGAWRDGLIFGLLRCDWEAANRSR